MAYVFNDWKNADYFTVFATNVGMGAVAAFSRLSPTMHSWAISIYSFDYQ